MKLARLILHYNTPELTDNLCRMVPGAIVLDNGSEKPYVGTNRCIRFKENYGFTRGWNEGIKAVYDEFDGFWLMNSDITITPANVARVEEVFNCNPEVKMFTPVYNCWMNHCKAQNKKGLYETGVLEFTAPVIRKEVFEQIGFFNEVFVRGYGVEFDFCYRMRQSGLKIAVDHSSSFYHIGHQTIKTTEGLYAYSRKANFELTHGLLQIYGWDWMGIVLKDIDIKTNFDMNIAVYTTIFGDYDQVKRWPKQNIKADYFVVTDNPDLKAEGWTTIVPDFPRKQLGSRLRAKFFKIFPWEIEALKTRDITVYVDASIEVTSDHFLDHCIRNLNNDMLLYKHPQRGCIYDEAIASKDLHKYQEEPIDAQVGFYRDFFGRHKGLYAGGVLVRKHTDKVFKLMGDWWFENIKWSYQDQLSLPVVFWANGFVPSTFKENQYHNEFFKVRWHDDVAPVERMINSRNRENNKTTVPVDTLPYISVVMPVYNTPVDLLEKAIDSIVNQDLWSAPISKDEAFARHEFLIADDGSTNASTVSFLGKLKEKYADAPFKLIVFKNNRGLARTLDDVIKTYARGKIILRMDADDIARKGLASAHYDFFRNPANKDKHVHGVQIELFTARRRWESKHSSVVTVDKAIKNKGYWLINHPGSAFRRDTFLSIGGYGKTPRHLAEDYVLWCKFLQAGYKLYNSNEVLLNYRAGDGSQIMQDRKSDNWLNHLAATKKKYLIDERL